LGAFRRQRSPSPPLAGPLAVAPPCGCRNQALRLPVMEKNRTATA
jgi:hypothetical protein